MSLDLLESLLNAALDFAVEHLRDQGSFYPFGAAVSEGEEPVLIGAFDADRERPAAESLVPRLRARLIEGVRIGSWDAIAIVTDVLAPASAGAAPSSAIRVELEHRDGSAVESFLFYAQDAETGELRSGRLVSQRREATLLVEGHS
jgi:hypothetical protein